MKLPQPREQYRSFLKDISQNASIMLENEPPLDLDNPAERLCLDIKSSLRRAAGSFISAYAQGYIHALEGREHANPERLTQRAGYNAGYTDAQKLMNKPLPQRGHRNRRKGRPGQNQTDLTSQNNARPPQKTRRQFCEIPDPEEEPQPDTAGTWPPKLGSAAAEEHGQGHRGHRKSKEHDEERQPTGTGTWKSRLADQIPAPRRRQHA